MKTKQTKIQISDAFWKHRRFFILSFLLIQNSLCLLKNVRNLKISKLSNFWVSKIRSWLKFGHFRCIKLKLKLPLNKSHKLLMQNMYPVHHKSGVSGGWVYTLTILQFKSNTKGYVQWMSEIQTCPKTRLRLWVNVWKLDANCAHTTS